MDHCGIIFNDAKNHRPHILEAVPWIGVKASPFQERLTQGEEFTVTIVPLNLPKTGDAARFREVD